MEGKEVYKKVQSDGIKNIIFYGVIFLIILFILKRWRVVGIVLSSIYGLIFLPSAVGYIASLVSGIIAIPIYIKNRNNEYESDYIEDQKWLWLATIPRTIEIAFDALFIFFLAKEIFI